jgi:uncharacterized protein (DUF427 family)
LSGKQYTADMVTEAHRLIIRESRSDYRLADAGAGQFQEIEGNWYVDPQAVDHKLLRITSHEYHCPYKGRCFYVDFDDGVRRVPRVAWIYDDPKSGWEHIRGKYGFYAGAVAAKFDKTKDSFA